MSKKVKIIIIAVIIICITVAAIIIFTSNKQQPSQDGIIDKVEVIPNKSNDMPSEAEPIQTTNQRSNDEISNLISQKNKNLIDSSTGLPIYSIVSKSSPLVGWYIVKIRNNKVPTSDATVIVQDNNGTMTIKAGPGTGLFNTPGLPGEVKDQLLAE